MNPIKRTVSRRPVRLTRKSTSAPPLMLDALEGRTLFSAPGMPTLNSLPGAPHTLYLDFDGYSAEAYGPSGITGFAGSIGIGAVVGSILTGPGGAFLPGVIGGIFGGEVLPAPSTPTFDLDGDPATFYGELATIKEIHARVAEDYAPFNINVTTIKPATLNDGDVRVSIGGDGSWWPADVPGVGIPADWACPTDHTAFSFADKIRNAYSGNAWDAAAIADNISHEAGHSLGLYHQAEFTSDDDFVAEYQRAAVKDGLSVLKSPLMGSPSPADDRATWWHGTNHMHGFPWADENEYQDDIAGLANKLGFRPDDHTDATWSATPLTYDAKQFALTGSGVISQTSDRDAFAFDVLTDGNVRAVVNVPKFGSMFIGNLAAKLEIRNASGALVAFKNATLTDNMDQGGKLGVELNQFLPAGRYTVVVTSHDFGTTFASGAAYDNYGDVGQYTLSVKQVEPPKIQNVTFARQYASAKEALTFTVRFDSPVLAFKGADVSLTDGTINRKPVAVQDSWISMPAGSKGDTWTIAVPAANTPAGGFRLKLGAGIVSKFNAPMNTTFPFDLLETTKPQLQSAAVVSGSVRLTFSEAVDPATVTSAAITKFSDALGLAVAHGAPRLTDLVGKRVYEVPLLATPIGGLDVQVSATAVKDMWSNTLDATYNKASFRDSAGPKVLGVRVVDQGSLRPDGKYGPATLLVAFDEAVDPTTFSAEDLRVTDPSGAVLNPFAITPSEDGRGFSFSVQRLPFEQDLGVTVGPDVRDVFGNRMDQDGDGVKGLNLVTPGRREAGGLFGQVRIVGADPFLQTVWNDEILQDQFRGSVPLSALPAPH